MRPVLAEGQIRGLAHITGGGITDNLPRILPDGCRAEIQIGSWPVLPIFELLAKIGSVTSEEMLRATNMGIGMIAVIRPNSLEAFSEGIRSEHFVIGRVVEGEGKVAYLA